MLCSKQAQLNTWMCWVSKGLFLVLLISNTVATAQTPESYENRLLPRPQLSSSPIPEEIIPVAKPTNAGEVVVEEQGSGLISLKVRDASLKQVVAMIAETQRVNVIFSSPEDAKVTGVMHRVPWLQALETVLASTGHAWSNDQGTLVITPLTAVDLVAPRAGGRRVETFELDFAKAVDVEQTVKGLLSPAGKSWTIESSSTNNRQTREVVAVLDFPGNLLQVADYVSQVDQPPRQVLIKVNILQIALGDDCRSGVNLQQLVSLAGNQISLSTIGFANGTPFQETTSTVNASGTNITQTTGASGNATIPNPKATNTSFLRLTGGSLDGLVELILSTTDAKTLASSELMVVSGQEARLQSGRALGFPITVTTQTSTTGDTKFLDVGVLLTATPQITRDGRVMMSVRPEVSDGRINPKTNQPEKETVEVETNVLLNNGQGMVIGGLIQETDQNIQSKVPWLGDLPYVGILFQKRNLIKSRTEIIVTLVPHIVPYAPIGVAENNHRFMRTDQPLLTPELCSFPRPYEPQLPDTFENPSPAFPRHYYRHMARQTVEVPLEEPLPTELLDPSSTPTRLPPIDPILEQAPLSYPPSSETAPTPAVEQATHRAPLIR